jgi:hypothetical protein
MANRLAFTPVLYIGVTFSFLFFLALATLWNFGAKKKRGLSSKHSFGVAFGL